MTRRETTLGLCLALLLTSGCRRAAPRVGESDLRSLRDGAGRTIRVRPRVLRAVSLAPSTTEILFALGAGEVVVGVDRYSNHPIEATRRKQVGSDIEPSLETIVGLRPDVVFTATSANAQGTVEALEGLGIPVYVSRANRLDEILADIGGVGEVVGRTAEAERLVATLRGRIAATQAPRRAPPRVLLVVWTDPLTVASDASHVGELLKVAGGVNVVRDTELPFPSYSVERVLADAPDVIVVGTHADNAPPMTPLLALTTVPAVRDRRIYQLDGDLLFRPGPRLIDGLAALRGVIHQGARPDAARPSAPAGKAGAR